MTLRLIYSRPMAVSVADDQPQRDNKQTNACEGARAPFSEANKPSFDCRPKAIAQPRSEPTQYRGEG